MDALNTKTHRNLVLKEFMRIKKKAHREKITNTVGKGGNANRGMYEIKICLDLGKLYGEQDGKR